MLQPIRPQDAGQIYQRQVASSEVTPAAPRRVDTAASHGGAGGRRTDRAMFSPAAMEMSRALSAVTDASDVRADRVEALRAAIEGGSYQVDADAIAGVLVEQGFGLDAITNEGAS